MRRLEEHIAHLARGLDDLSEVVARQQHEIDRLTRRVEMLLAREAALQDDGGNAAPVDQRPPHW